MREFLIQPENRNLYHISKQQLDIYPHKTWNWTCYDWSNLKWLYWPFTVSNIYFIVLVQFKLHIAVDWCNINGSSSTYTSQITSLTLLTNVQEYNIVNHIWPNHCNLALLIAPRTPKQGNVIIDLLENGFYFSQVT